MQHNETALPIGAELLEYRIESVLGVGGFGITYLALDTNLNKQVVIKEFLPSDIAVRKESTTVVAKSYSDEESYNWGIDRFLKEAQTLAKFNHPNIVKISRFFKANNTAYFVMDYEKGEDLQEYLSKQTKRLTQEEINDIILPILDGLKEVHKYDFLHRDIKPGNIFMRTNGSPMLIDFGASRFAMGAKSKSLSIVLTEGYAPKEQYSSTSKQGAYTDIYCMGAVLYKMITDKVPPEASTRSDLITDGEEDPYQRLQDDSTQPYSNTFKQAIDWALAFRPKDRPQSVKALFEALTKTDRQEDVKTRVVEKNTQENKTKVITPKEHLQAKTRLVENISKSKTSHKSKNSNRSYTIPIVMIILTLLLASGWYIVSDMAQIEKEDKIALANRLAQKEEEAKKEQQRLNDLAKEKQDKIDKQLLELEQLRKEKLARERKAQKDKEAALIAQQEKEAKAKAKRLAQEKAEAKRIAEENSKFSLTINTKPSNAKVQITNIKPRYRDGMRLKKGTYKIKVSKKGYKSIRKSISLKRNLTYDVVLKQEEKKIKKESNKNLKGITKIGKRMWQDQSINKTKLMTWNQAMAYCRNLTLGGYSDWSLPSKRVLSSLYPHKSRLKHLESYLYWSSTTVVGYESLAWVVYFYGGGDRWRNKSYSGYIRCVRDGQ